MSPKVVDKQQRRKEIAAVALEVFADTGFESSSMRQIAQAAGIGKGTVYEYFSSKEELLQTALLNWAERLSRSAEEALAGVDDPAERLRVYVHAVMDAFLSDERTMRIFVAMLQMVVLSRQRPLLQRVAQEMLADFRQAIVELLRDGVSKGFFRPKAGDQVAPIAVNLAAYLDGIALHHFVGRGDLRLKEQVDFHLAQLMDHLKPGPSAPLRDSEVKDVEANGIG